MLAARRLAARAAASSHALARWPSSALVGSRGINTSTSFLSRCTGGGAVTSPSVPALRIRHTSALGGSAPTACCRAALMRPSPLLPSSGRRLLSSSPGGDNFAKAGAAVTLVRQAMGWANQNRTVVGVLTVAAVVMYGFYRGSFYIMHFFFNVSDKQIFEIGLVCGVLMTLSNRAPLFGSPLLA